MVTTLLPHVLVIDPDPEARSRLTDALQARFQVSTATSLAEAIQHIVVHHPVVIITEWEFPDGTAQAFIQRVRAASTLSAPVIACVSSNASIRAKVSAFHAGADDYVVKDIDPTTFAWRIILLRRIRRAS